MTVTVVPTPPDASTIAGSDTLSYHLHENLGFAGNFSTIRIAIEINGGGSNFIYDTSGPFSDSNYTISDLASGTTDGDLSFSKNVPFNNGDVIQVIITAFADFDGGNFTFNYTVGGGGGGGGPTMFTLEKMTVRSPSGTGLAVGDNTVPRSQKRAKFGQLLYVWSAETLTDEERGYLGLPLDDSSVPKKPGHIDYVTNSHGYWDRVDVSEVNDAGLTPIRDNICGVFDSIDWAALEIAGGLTLMNVVIGTPSRMTYAIAVRSSLIDAEALTLIDGGDGPGYARANLLQNSNHGGPSYPQAPNTGTGTNARLYEFAATDTTFVNADNGVTVIPAGSPIPVPDTLDINGVQPWEFMSAGQIRIHPPYFNPTSTYALDYEVLVRVQTRPFPLSNGSNVPEDYVWLVDFPRYLRHNVEESLVPRVEQAQFQANFQATLSERADVTQSASLTVNNGIEESTISFADWNFVDAKTIQINSALFDQNSLYTISYTAKVPNVVPGPKVMLEWRAGATATAINSVPGRQPVLRLGRLPRRHPEPGSALAPAPGHHHEHRRRQRHQGLRPRSERRAPLRSERARPGHPDPRALDIGSKKPARRKNPWTAACTPRV
jgi:hypothetical protein